MKSAMNSHVGQRSREMFRESTETVKSRLDQICTAARDRLRLDTEYVISSISRDYRTLFGGQQFQTMPQPHILAEDRALKEDISAQIEETHEVFRKVVGAPSPTPEPMAEPMAEPEVEQQESEVPEAGIDAAPVEAAQEIKESVCEDPVENQIKINLEAAV
jgi:hypothetical protein